MIEREQWCSKWKNSGLSVHSCSPSKWPTDKRAPCFFASSFGGTIWLLDVEIKPYTTNYIAAPAAWDNVPYYSLGGRKMTNDYIMTGWTSYPLVSFLCGFHASLKFKEENQKENNQTEKKLLIFTWDPTHPVLSRYNFSCIYAFNKTKMG